MRGLINTYVTGLGFVFTAWRWSKANKYRAVRLDCYVILFYSMLNIMRVCFLNIWIEGFPMSQNLRLVEYFLSEFYKNRTLELAHIVSPNFYYCVNGGEKEDFETYVQRMNLIFKNSDSFMTPPQTEDDQIFAVDYVISIETNGSIERLYGVAKYNIVNGLLENIHITHHNDQQEIDRLRNLMLSEQKQPTSFFL